MKFVFHDKARAELVDTARYYETQSPGLGEKFLNAISQASELTTSHPFIGIRMESLDVRVVFVRNFPYKLIYKTYEDHILAIAFAHQKRDQSYWVDRLNELLY